jgi:short-subunit dehydrogenase
MKLPHNKSVVVTGGTAGLGLALANYFAREGAKVAIIGRDAARLQAAAESLAGDALQPVLALQADLTKSGDVQRVMSQAAETNGGIDMLINCAGRSARAPIAETSAEQFQELLEINFLAAVRCTQAALPHLISAKGHVVFIGSLASKVAARYLGAYPASKFPLAAYSQQLRLELGPQGLHSLLVCPGPIRRDDAGQRYNDQATNLPESARRPGGGAKLRGIDPADLARRIVRACQRRQPELIVPAKARFLFAIAQLWPTLGDRLLLKFTGD